MQMEDYQLLSMNLKKLTRIHIEKADKDTDYLTHKYEEEFLNDLCHSIVSLVVRSPQIYR